MSFRIGRKSAQHSYPEPQHGIGSGAVGPKGSTGPLITSVDLAPGTVLASVTVTPKVSGKFKLSASVVGQNNDDTAHTLGLQFGRRCTRSSRPSVSPSRSI